MFGFLNYINLGRPLSTPLQDVEYSGNSKTGRKDYLTRFC